MDGWRRMATNGDDGPRSLGLGAVVPDATTEPCRLSRKMVLSVLLWPWERHWPLISHVPVVHPHAAFSSKQAGGQAGRQAGARQVPGRQYDNMATLRRASVQASNPSPTIGLHQASGGDRLETGLTRTSYFRCLDLEAVSTRPHRRRLSRPRWRWMPVGGGEPVGL